MYMFICRAGQTRQLSRWRCYNEKKLLIDALSIYIAHCGNSVLSDNEGLNNFAFLHVTRAKSRSRWREVKKLTRAQLFASLKALKDVNFP